MNKKVLAIAFAAMAAFGISASAQTPAANQAPCCAENSAAPGANDKMARPQKFTDFAFEGILLDIPQQARMDSLNAAVKVQREQARPQRKQRGDRKGQINCPAGQACVDSACVAQPCGPRDGRRGPGRRVSADYVAKVKEILTPEQYTTFLENIVLMPENCAAQPQNDKCGFNNKERGRHHGNDKARGHHDHNGKGAQAKSRR